MEYTFFIGTFIGMRTKVITLSLDEVSWQKLRNDNCRSRK